MYIYKTTNLINGKIYIGQSSRDFEKSIYYYGSGRVLRSAIRKYGKENFTKELLEICFSTEHLDEREKYWIIFFNSRNHEIGYNLSEGGSGVSNFSRKSISDKNKGRNVGEKNGMFGKKGELCPVYGKHFKCPEEKKIRYSEMFKGDKNPRFGVNLDKETKQKISTSLKGKFQKENNPNYGRKYTEEVKRKISISLKNRICLVCPHCLLASKNNANMSRYHFDNCKFRIKVA